MDSDDGGLDMDRDEDMDDDDDEDVPVLTAGILKGWQKAILEVSFAF